MSTRKQRNANAIVSPPSYSFRGTNASHAKDNGAGSRTYNIPNYATSYASEGSRLIAVSIDEDRGSNKLIIVLTFLSLLLVGLPILLGVGGPKAHGTSQVYWDVPDATRRRDPDWNARQSQKVDSKPPSNRASETRPDERHIDARVGMYWSEFRASKQCAGFGLREYTARLWGVPSRQDWERFCRSTEAQIAGVVYSRPDFCEDRGVWGGVVGHWVVQTDDLKCRPSWGSLINKGCSKPGLHRRRLTSRIWGVGSEDWKKMCTTTPTPKELHENHLQTPVLCEDKGWMGKYGVWEIEDLNC